MTINNPDELVAYLSMLPAAVHVARVRVDWKIAKKWGLGSLIVQTSVVVANRKIPVYVTWKGNNPGIEIILHPLKG